MILSKPKDCGCYSQKISNNATTECVRRLSTQLAIREDAPKGIVLTILVGAIIIGGAFALGLGAGLFASGRQNRTQITQTINQIVINSFKTTLEQMYTQSAVARQRAGNNITIVQDGGQCNFTGTQKVDQYIAIISTLEGNVKNEFINRSLTEFTNQIKLKMGNVTDPVTELAKALKGDQLQLCQQIYQEFRNTIETVFTINLKQLLDIEHTGNNVITFYCRAGKGTYYIGQEIFQTAIAQQTMKVISDNISKNELVTRVYNATGGEISEWSSGTLMILGIVFIIALALLAYFYFVTPKIF